MGAELRLRPGAGPLGALCALVEREGRGRGGLRQRRGGGHAAGGRGLHDAAAHDLSARHGSHLRRDLRSRASRVGRTRSRPVRLLLPGCALADHRRSGLTDQPNRHLLRSVVMVYRVIQWGTGNVGTHALRAIIERTDMELVGLRVYSPDKVGKDAGEVVGASPTGVLATDDVDAILALDADCVNYNALGTTLEDPLGAPL